jgi:hypothetical protein
MYKASGVARLQLNMDYSQTWLLLKWALVVFGSDRSAFLICTLSHI